MPLPDYQTLVLRGAVDANALLPHLGTLERDVLPTWLSTRRWFAAKDRALRGVRIARRTPLPGPDGLTLLEIEAELEHGEHERYILPLGIVWDREQPSVLAEQLALARVRHGREVGYLTDGFALKSLTRTMLGALRERTVLSIDGESHAGADAAPEQIRFCATQALAAVAIADDAEIRWLSAEQSNSSLIVGDKAVFKLLRRVSAGINPEIEIGERLTSIGYANAAPLLGHVTRVDVQGGETTLALLQGFVRNQGDAWRWTLDHLARGAEEYAAAQDDAARHESVAGYDAFAEVVGRRLAELHDVLAQPTDAAAFAPQAVDVAAAQRVVAGVAHEVQAMWDTLVAHRDVSDDGERAAVDALLAERPRLDAWLQQAPALLDGALLTRVHGDFHLGQILVAFDDVVLIDFEGEPAKSLDERRAKASPLHDVAGFLRSLDYASEVSARGEEGTAARAGVGLDSALDAFLSAFRSRASATFLSAYRKVLDASPHPWVAPAAFEATTLLFLIEKASYEIRYEAANRPAWIMVPIQGLLRILERFPAPEEAIR